MAMEVQETTTLIQVAQPAEQAAAQAPEGTWQAAAPGSALPPAGARVVRSRLAQRFLSFMMVFGPGLIVMVADNDAGAVSSYTQAGAQYGLKLTWLMLLLLPVTFFCQ